MQNHSRRQFLHDTLWSAATAVIASNLPLQPCFAGDQQSRSPSERLRIAVLGVGKRGIDHATAFASRQDTEVAIICDADTDTGQKRCDELLEKTGRRPHFEQDLRKVIDNKSIDIVSIALPNHWHALAAIWAMQAGKDVYVEKPVSHNIAEGRAVVDSARKYKRICQTGTQHRSLPGLRDAIAYLHSGKLGDVKIARGLCYKPRRSIGPPGSYLPPPSVNYDLWCGPAPVKPVTRKKFHYDWHWFWDYGNGEIGNQGVHQMDIARWGLGADTKRSSVISFGGRFRFNDAGETVNTQLAVYGYGPQSLLFEIRALETADRRGVRIGVIFEGTQGSLVWNSVQAGGIAFDLDNRPIETFLAGAGDHFDNFVQAVRCRRVEALHADILEGHLSSALCHLGNISHRLGNDLLPEAAREIAARIENFDSLQETVEQLVAHLRANRWPTGDDRYLRAGELLAFDTRLEKFINHSRADTYLTRADRKPFVAE
ncbi:MAG: Gfo/Idh/MocA family oxidoreductase [Pirellulales bacterium]|nr:Gfo/Idh/MocA family oxidoreductase [Pirellulales bacterium]